MSSKYVKLYEYTGDIPDHNIYNVDLATRLFPEGRNLKVLDAGCAFGIVTKAIKDLGHEVIGIDIQEEYIRTARNLFPGIRFEVESVTGDLKHLMPKGGWDVIVSTEVIEHLYAPQRFLENMNKHLKSGGTLLIGTPYHGYFKNLAIALVNKFDYHFMVDEEGGHIKFFSPKTLAAMLRQTGFEPIDYLCAGRCLLIWRGMMYKAIKK